ncbi:3-deoxy-D-manno-octulosonic acid transferase [Grimontia sp. S25]|uniref:3-deoxy-D-manno-octulosonic acid transferase n=1 Tax=Grimontia sedimenti TaxID=2711294 RepID=A0A6M1RGC1_9GAMM|nr:3-deoxy-D-manno-octulosonic acid transferase [Grimontia sedimenti]
MLARFIYTLLLAIVSPVLLWSLYRRRTNKPRIGNRWKEHWGYTPTLQGKKPLWIHAVSVGEVLAVSPLIRELKQKEPSLPVLLTTTTSTGAVQAEKLGTLVEHRYMPIDFSHCINRFLKTVKPRALIIVETELWPNTLHTVHQNGIPVTVINARLSERSASGYRKIQPLFNVISNSLSEVLCLHQDDKQRFIQLGVDGAKVYVSGSIKYDLSITPETLIKGQRLRYLLGPDRPIWIAASTHKGEDEKMLNIHRRILEKSPNTLLVLVPRHPERFDDVERLCHQQALQTVRRSHTDEKVTAQTQVYLGDTMGELLVMLECADITVMGGSLIGDKVGGHNLLEPATLGKPSLIGPSFFNFTDVTNQLSDAGATNVCADETVIAERLFELFTNPQKRLAMSIAAEEVVQKNKGAIAFTIDHILSRVSKC